MLVEVVQTVAGWLSASGTGVNALLPDVPRYSGDPAPPSVTVVHAFRDNEAARGQMRTSGLPVLDVGLFQDPSQDVRPAVAPYAAHQRVSLHIRYGAAKSTETAKALRDAAYTLRVVRKILAREGIGAKPTVNQAQLYTLGAVRMTAAYVADGDTVTTGALVCELEVTDFYTKAGQ